MKDRAIAYVKSFAHRFVDDDVPSIGAELAYRFLFAVFPFGIFLASLGGFVADWAGIDNPALLLTGAVRDNLPAEVAGEVVTQLDQVIGTTQPGLLSFGAVAAIWAAAGGTGTLMKAMNRALDVEEGRGFVRRTAVAIALTLVGGVGILVSFVTIVGGSAITEQLGEVLGVGEVARTLIAVARWPVVLLILGLAVGALFRYAPNVRVSWRYTLAGGMVFAVLWIAATALFGLYVANFSNYANTYGALGGVIALMLWFYLTGVMLVSAAELVAVVAKDREPSLEPAVPPPADATAHAPADAAAHAPAAATVAPAGPTNPTNPPNPSPLAPPNPPSPGRAARHVVRDAVAREPDGRVRRERASPAVAALIIGAGALVGALAGRLTGSAADDGG